MGNPPVRPSRTRFGLLIAAGLLLGGLAPSSAASPSPSATAGDLLAAELVGPGRLVACSSFPSVRFAERDANGDPFGVDVEIGQELARRLGLEAVVQERAFEELLGAVVSRECDISIAGQFITSDRLRFIDMIAYRQGTPHIVVRAGDPLAAAELVGMCGRRLAVVSGTVYVDMVRGRGDYTGIGVDDGCRAAGLGLVELGEYPDQQQAEDALLRGETDAYSGNDFVTRDRPEEFALGAALPPIRNGIGHRKGAVALDAALRTALRSMVEDGSYLAILEKHDVGHAAVTSVP